MNTSRVTHHANGAVKDIINEKDGIKHGAYKCYRSDGTLFNEATFFNGELHGAYCEYYRNGQISYACEYDLGKVISARTFDADGTKLTSYVH